MTSYACVAEAFADTGLVLRGGFHFERQEEAPSGPNGAVGTCIVLVGNVGPGLWHTFGKMEHSWPNPLDRWTAETVGPIASALGARAVYPSDKPYQPFQRWAMRAEPVQPSPLGILIHPEHGLWHAYRAALIFSQALDIPARRDEARPCDSCADKPCLATCPVVAFGKAGYDVPKCVAHIQTEAGVSCLTGGCLARAACPVGGAYGRYHTEQAGFHMAAFLRARLAAE